MYFQKVKVPVRDGINFIPEDAVFIIESKQLTTAWKKLSQTNVMWEALLSSDVFEKLDKQGNFIDSILQANPNVYKLLENRSMYISAHLTSKKEYDFLFTYSLPNLTYQSDVEDFIESLYPKVKPVYRKFENQEIATIRTNSTSFSYAFIDGTLILSFNEPLIERSIKQIKEGKSLANNVHFNAILNSSGKNVDANIFVNYKLFSSILQTYTHPSLTEEMQGFSEFAQYSGWDVSIKPNALMLNGFTYVNDSNANFLTVFRNQKPQNIEITNVAPSKTAILQFYGISNFKTYINDYKKYRNSKQDTTQSAIDELNKKYNITLDDSFFQWFDNEIALVITETRSANVYENAFAYLHSNDVGEALSSLNAITDKINTTDTLKTDTLTFKNHFINKLNIPKFIPSFLGLQFNKIQANYYTSIDNYIVFGNSMSALQSIITDFENNKTLANDESYKAFAENISNHASVYVYSSMYRSTSIYKAFLNEEQQKILEQNEQVLKKFEAVAFQYTSSDKLFYSNAYLKYNPFYKKEVETIWETKLDTTISTKPTILLNHITKSKEILVQDDANKIYLISNTGKILWTKQISEKIMSAIIQVDALKNNKLQLLFNTRSFIYLFDRNGNDMKGFPIKLEAAATNALSVFDYDKNRDYRIFVATSDKKVSCFKINGEQVNGFKFDKTNDQVIIPIQYAEIDGKDHLFIVDIKGKIYVINRQGETKVKLKERLPQGIKSFEVETGKNYSKTYIVSSDTLGNVVKISLTNTKEGLTFQDFETVPYFLYADVNNDKMKEFIFLTRTQLTVFSQDKSILFKYQFESTGNQAPICFAFPDGSVKIGVVLDAINELFLINSDGTLFNGFPLKGKTLFSIANLNNEENNNLITGGTDNSVYMYPIE